MCVMTDVNLLPERYNRVPRRRRTSSSPRFPTVPELGRPQPSTKKVASAKIFVGSREARKLESRRRGRKSAHTSIQSATIVNSGLLRRLDFFARVVCCIHSVPYSQVSPHHSHVLESQFGTHPLKVRAHLRYGRSRPKRASSSKAVPSPTTIRPPQSLMCDSPGQCTAGRDLHRRRRISAIKERRTRSWACPSLR